MAKEKMTQEQKEQARQEKAMQFDGKHIYFPSTKKTAKEGKTVDCKDIQTGYYTDNAIAMNCDKYNYTIVTESADGTCYVDSYTRGKETTASYARNHAYAQLIKSQSKQVAISALRGLPFAKVMEIVKSSKDFKPCTNETILAWFDNALKAQAERKAKAEQEQPKQDKPKRQPKTKKEQPVEKIPA